MVRTLRLELPEPPKEWNPNSNTIRFLKRKASIMCHAEVETAVKDSGYDREQPAIERAVVTVTFIVPTRARRDKGNLI